ncbi:Imm50 family immunity protein [Pantoea cypripedii]|nr:Imm50 family immunity protein [Pantoea cypripedii]MBP2195841.1 hypothetical protein [Pantoea cypripedii]
MDIIISPEVKMWFDNALHKEKVVHMLGGELCVDCAEFQGFYFNEISSLKVYLIVRGIPKIHPKKWDEKRSNAIALTLGFVGIKKFKSEGNRINFICSPKIDSTVGNAVIRIENENFNFFCEAEFLDIEGITPYNDERWD